MHKGWSTFPRYLSKQDNYAWGRVIWSFFMFPHNKITMIKEGSTNPLGLPQCEYYASERVGWHLDGIVHDANTMHKEVSVDHSLGSPITS